MHTFNVTLQIKRNKNITKIDQALYNAKLPYYRPGREAAKHFLKCCNLHTTFVQYFEMVVV